MLGEIFKVKAFVTGMIAENRSWDGTALYLHMRNDRKFYCDGAAAKSGHIINDCDFFLFIMIGHGDLPFMI